ncbi:TetR/AcrR family transcriptional regulator [Candidatus Roizmanbacteria bacterium]|nr:TetR/AcrR family transcriptional regulator [Candidatus Roizmanbacteria bacterium]
MKQSDPTRIKILAAAEQVFARRGFTEASIDSVAEKAGVAKGTIYYHFQSKDELFFELIDRGIDDLSELVHRHLNRETTQPALYTLIEAHLLFFTQRKEFCQVLFSEVWRLKTYWKKDIMQLKAKYHSQIVQVIQERQPDLIPKGSVFTADMASQYVFWLVSMIGLHRLLQKSGESSAGTVEHLYRFISAGLRG